MRRVLLAMLAALAVPAPAGAQTLIQEPVLPNGHQPQDLTYDGFGNRWYINYINSQAGKVAPDGTLLAQYGPGNANGGPPRFLRPNQIVRGPGGFLWFTTREGNGIGRIDPGALADNFDYFELPSSGDIDDTGSGTARRKATHGISFEPPDTLWFTLPAVDHIGKAVISSTGTPTSFSYKKLGFCCHRNPRAVAMVGGSLWIAQSDGIARANPALSDYSSATPADYQVFKTDQNPDLAPVMDLVGGSDGNVWFTMDEAGKLGRVTPAGEVTTFPLAPSSRPSRIALGPDGNVWAAETGVARIARLTPAGLLSEFQLPPGSTPQGIAPGPAGFLSFGLPSQTDSNAHRLGRLPIDLTPQVATGAGGPGGPATANVAGSVHPRALATTYVFEYGPTAAYGSETAPAPAGSGDSAVEVTAALTGLRAATTYHYRLRATNAFGTTVGADRTVTTPAGDADGDGVVAGPDCVDTDPRIRPGATDVPENGIDEDCAGGDARFPVLRASLSVTWSVFADFTKLGRFRLRELAGGETIRLKCRGRGCPFKSRRLRATKAGGLDLLALVRRARFRPAAVLEARVAKTGFVGRYVKVTFRRAKRPRLARSCLRPGASTPSRCPS